MPYFERTYKQAEYEMAFKYSQPKGWCFAHCTDWLWVATHLNTCGSQPIDPSGCLMIRFTARSALKSESYKYPIYLLKSDNLRPESRRDYELKQQEYASSPTDALAWGYINEGCHFTVESAVTIPVASHTTGLSSQLTAYTHALIGWRYKTHEFARSVDNRNHQTAMFQMDGKVHFFDPNIGHFVVAEEKFSDFFSKYYQDVVENEKNNTKGYSDTFYDNIYVTGIKAV